MNEEFEINRDALAAMHLKHHAQMMKEAVARGDVPEGIADRSLAHFAESAALEQLVQLDVQVLEAMLKGQVH